MGQIVDYNAPIVRGGNFTWREYAWLPQWEALLVPTEEQIESARFLFLKLQPLREELGEPLIVTSGARNMEYTRHLRANGVHAAMGSMHLRWGAVDLIAKEMPVKDLWHWFDERWPGRMEFFKYTQGWVHIDIKNWGSRIRFRP